MEQNLMKTKVNNIKLNMLLEEYKLLQDKIAHYDNLRFLIKGWSISLLSGLIVFEKDIIILAITGLVLIFSFLFFELLTKETQAKFICRFNKVEYFLQKDQWYTDDFSISIEKIVPDLLGSKSVRDISKKTSFGSIAKKRDIYLLYCFEIILLVIVCIIGAC